MVRRERSTQLDIGIEEQNLWERYHKNRSQQNRNALAELYLPLVKDVARSVKSNLPKSVDVEDLESNGFFGLIDAIGKFDPTYEVKFRTYAQQRVRGAILDELRALDWVPRSLRAITRKIDKETTELELNLGRTPTEDELATNLGLSIQAVRQVKASLPQLGSLDHALSSTEPDSGSFSDILTQEGLHEDDSDHIMLRERLTKNIEGLSERDQILLWLYYHEDLTLKNVGIILGITDSRVCQIHTKAVLDLFNEMTQ